MKWEQAIEHYQNYLRIERGLSENFISNYSFDINKLLRWLEKNELSLPPTKITEVAIVGKKKHLQNGKASHWFWTIKFMLTVRLLDNGLIISMEKNVFNPVN